MSYYVRHRFGGNDSNPPLEALDDLVRERDDDREDLEHPSVSVVHDSDWAVAAYTDGLVTLEHLEDFEIEPRHLSNQEREAARRLLATLAAGRLDEVFAHPWQPGYGDSA